jgi:hypothetical protein
MSDNLDEDLQGLLRVLIILVAVFAVFTLVVTLFDPSVEEHLLP